MKVLRDGLCSVCGHIHVDGVMSRIEVQTGEWWRDIAKIVYVCEGAIRLGILGVVIVVCCHYDVVNLGKVEKIDEIYRIFDVVRVGCINVDPEKSWKLI